MVSACFEISLNSPSTMKYIFLTIALFGVNQRFVSTDAGDTWAGPTPTGTERATFGLVGTETSEVTAL